MVAADLFHNTEQRSIGRAAGHVEDAEFDGRACGALRVRTNLFVVERLRVVGAPQRRPAAARRGRGAFVRLPETTGSAGLCS